MILPWKESEGPECQDAAKSLDIFDAWLEDVRFDKRLNIGKDSAKSI